VGLPQAAYAPSALRMAIDGRSIRCDFQCRARSRLLLSVAVIMLSPSTTTGRISVCIRHCQMPFPTKYYRQIGTASGIDGVVACGPRGRTNLKFTRSSCFLDSHFVERPAWCFDLADSLLILADLLAAVMYPPQGHVLGHVPGYRGWKASAGWNPHAGSCGSGL